MPSKRNADFTATNRALSLYSRLLYSGKKLFLADLATELNCSKSTVDRTMQTIEQAGIGRLATALENGKRWYRLEELPGTPNIVLSAADIEKLALCRDLLGQLLPEGIERLVAANIDKISALLPKGANRGAATASKATHVAWGRVDCTPFQKHLENMLVAISNRRVCQVEYRDPEYRFPERGREPVTYFFLPVRLAHEGGTLNIEGWRIKDGSRGELDYALTFELHRIISCKPTETVFEEVPPLPERKGAFGLVGFEPFPVRVAFCEEFGGFIRERIWSEGQELVDLPDGGVELRFMAADEDELIGWVLSFGNGAELLEPAHLREQLLEEASDIWELYAPEEEKDDELPERAEMVREIMDFMSKADNEGLKELARKGIWENSENEAE